MISHVRTSMPGEVLALYEDNVKLNIWHEKAWFKRPGLERVLSPDEQCPGGLARLASS